MVLVISWLCFVVTKIDYNDLPNILLVPRSAAALVPWFPGRCVHRHHFKQLEAVDDRLW